MVTKKITTLSEFILDKQKDFPFATGDLSALLGDIALAAKLINRKVNKAGLVDILGDAGSNNIHGEEVKKLDVFAHEQMTNCLRVSGECAGIASEESDGYLVFDDDRSKKAKYVVCYDPLDGSSNIDVNISIGTIFAIYRKVNPEGVCNELDFLQAGNKLVAAGYVIYGSSTMLVYTTGNNNVNGFTLDPSIGEFCLSHPNIRIPEKGGIYSVNESYWNTFSIGVNNFIRYCKTPDKASNRPYNSRYIGTLVSDFHRNLIKGGIFMYPATTSHPDGKLRLLYECNPMAFLAENAGGMAMNGKKRILDIVPTELHQRVPLFTGSKDMVEKAMEFVLEDELILI